MFLALPYSYPLRNCLFILICASSTNLLINQSIADEINTDTTHQTKSSHKNNHSIEEVVIHGNNQEFNPTTIDPETAKLINSAGAANDPLFALQSLPGVTFVSDESAEPAVRGSSPNDNSYFIDFVPAKYIFHAFGSSIFRPETVQQFQLLPAAFSSSYGNATGAIVDVRLRDPVNQPLHTTLNYSLIKAAAFLEGGITDTQAFYLSLQRSMLDVYYSPDNEPDEEGVKLDTVPRESDYQFKYVWHLADQHKLSFLALGSDDNVAATFTENSVEAAEDPDFKGPASLSTEFNSQGLIWDWNIKNSGSYLKSALSKSNDKESFTYGGGQFERTKNNYLFAKTHLGFSCGNNHQLLTGITLEQRTLNYDIDTKVANCDEINPDCNFTDAEYFRLKNQIKIKQYNTFIEDQWQLTENLQLTSGLHLTRDNYLKDPITEPRLRLGYRTGRHTINIAYGKHHQFPEEQYFIPILGNPKIKSPKANHYAIAVENDRANPWHWKTEIYYKQLEDLILAIHESSPDAINNYSNEGEGQTYGLELLLNRKAINRWSGWLTLSLAKSNRKHGRTGKKVPFEFDRPAILNLVGNYRINELWTMGFKWRIQSGALYTPIVDLKPSERFDDIMLPVYGETYSERASVYHRLDLRFERFRSYAKFDYRFYIDLLNAYAQENIEEYYYAPKGTELVSPPAGYGKNIPVQKGTGMEFYPSLGFEISF